MSKVSIASIFASAAIACMPTSKVMAQAELAQAQGKLISEKLVASYTSEQVVGLLKEYFNLPGEDLGELIATATPVDAYAISYRTSDPAGRAVTASGLVAFPSPANGIYPVMQYHHGTQFNNQDVPSNPTRSPEAALSIAVFAAHGYVVSLPDYLGQGKATPPHPYLHARSVATSCADMLKAVSELCAKRQVKTNQKLFICGLSEGGYSTMALQRRIEQDATAQPFKLTASVPIAGPYDLPASWRFLSNTNAPGCSPLIAHLYMSYKKIYGFKDNLRNIFVPPYDRSITRIDNGRYNGNEMYTMLPKTVKEMMRGAFLDAVASGGHPMDEALAGNSTFRFAPVTPTRLYHGIDDELLPYSMSEMTCAYMKQLGAKDVEVVNVGAGIGHEKSIIPSFLLAKRWFDILNAKTADGKGDE